MSKVKQCNFTVFALMIFLFSWTSFVYAYESIGEASTNLLDVAFAVKMIIRAMFMIAGSAFFMGGVYKFRQYRQNSVEHRLSTAIVFAILGIALFGITFIPMTVF